MTDPVTVFTKSVNQTMYVASKQQNSHGHGWIAPNIGDVFGAWTVIGETTVPGSQKHQLTPCRCVCGTVCRVRLSRLAKGEATMCRQCTRKTMHKTHGLVYSTEYITWRNIMTRVGAVKTGLGQSTYNPPPDSPTDKTYRQRRIGICERWLHFENFLADMGCRPEGCTSIDRIDNTQGYSKENCRWATRIMQANNKSNNVNVTWDGETHTLTEWARLKGILPGTLVVRYRYGDRPPRLFRQTRKIRNHRNTKA